MTRRVVLLPLVAVVGAFTWPTAEYAALGLFALSRAHEVLRPGRWWGVLTAGTLAIAIPALAVVTYRCGEDCATPLMRDAVFPSVLWLSVIVLALWIYFAMRPLLELLTVSNVLRAVHWPRLLGAVVLFPALAQLHHQLAVPSERPPLRTLFNVALGGIAKPGGFLVADAAYFGVAVPLLVLTWRRAVDELRRFGVGAVAMVAVFLLSAITSEARLLSTNGPCSHGWPPWSSTGSSGAYLMMGAATVVCLGIMFWLVRDPVTGDGSGDATDPRLGPDAPALAQ